MMQKNLRFRFWDYGTGSEYIADRISGHWQFSEREWGGVRWYDVPATPLLRLKLEAWLKNNSHSLAA